MRSALRPVGEAIPRPAAALEAASEPLAIAGYLSQYLRSGTEALTLAVRTAVDRGRHTGRRRVLMPAYACPDLVSATIAAGGEAVPVDVAADRPFMDRSAAARELERGGVAAVIATHFLGMADDMRGWRKLTVGQDVCLIEDSAQLLPVRAGHVPSGDFVILSFGRGKPLNAGGGGALLSRIELQASGGCEWGAVAGQSAGSAALAEFLRRWAFNLAIRPMSYGLLRAVPALAIGETRYRPAREHTLMDRFTARVLATAMSLEPRTPTPAQREFERAFRALPAGWIDLPRAIVQGGIPPLLRYPLLAPDRSERDRVVARLDRFGASRFYDAALPDLPGLPSVASSNIDEARRFADRLLTLPVHSAVDGAAIDTIIAGVLGA